MQRTSDPARDTLAPLILVGGAVSVSALLSAIVSPSPARPSIRRDYKRLDKPSWTPPDWAFGIWAPLYTMMVAAGVRLWRARRGPHRWWALAHLFAAQALDALWLWLGFGWRDRGAMAVAALATVANGGGLLAAARRTDRAAMWLLVPYVAWIGYAAALSVALWRRNDAAGPRRRSARS